MKVNISYTIDLDEVLEEINVLYHKSLSSLDQKTNIYNGILGDNFEELRLEEIIMALEHNLECYQDHQTKVMEILNILQGYKNIKEGNVDSPELQEQDGEDK